MKKYLKDLSIADLVGLKTYLTKELEIAKTNNYGRLSEKIETQLERISNELDNRILEIEDLKV